MCGPRVYSMWVCFQYFNNRGGNYYACGESPFNISMCDDYYTEGNT